MAKLSQYKAKRKFDETKEPKGGVKIDDKEKIFVIQKHWASHIHFDFRLESEGVLKSWAVPKGIPNPGEKRLAMMVEDHPFDYKDFEGVIPEGNYGAGTVMVWDNGTYGIKDNASLDLKIKKGDFSFSLNGEKIRGEFSLVKLKKSEKNEWLLICQKREEINMNKDLSVKSHLTKEEIENGKIDFKKIKGIIKTNKLPIQKPMLASLETEPFNDNEWIFEIKWDGYRILASKNKDVVKLLTRNGKNLGGIYADIVKEISKLTEDFVLDGEVVAIDEKGNSSFQLLQNYAKDQKAFLLYYVFDILYLDGFDLRQVALLDRKEILKSFLGNKNLKHIKLSEYIDEKGKELFKVVEEHKGEGIIAKRKYGIYKPGIRSKDWLKFKTMKTQDVIICGYTMPRGSRKKFGALVVGIWNEGEIIFAGHVGGGFDDEKLKLLSEKMKPLEVEKSPFKIVPKTNMPVKWLKPKLIAEVKFSEWTQDGSMRQPIFLRIRDDKDVSEATLESSQIHADNGPENGSDGPTLESNLKLSNPDKIYWPEEGYTKNDLIEYYKNISSYILPFLKDRPQSLNRFPNGIKGKSFFQKNITNAPSWIKTIKIFSESENKYINYLICNDKESLLYLTNLGCIELNVWNSTIHNLDNPDYIVFDIDPPEKVPFAFTVEIAKYTKRILDKLKLISFCKTSGSKGLHIFIPLKPIYSYEQIKEFARLINMVVNQKFPEKTTLERKPEKRENKIYLDYLQNRKGQTMAASYCLRPKSGAPVSTPLYWNELNSKLDPMNFNMKNIFKRLKRQGDPWKDFFKSKNDNLGEAITELEILLKGGNK